MTVELKPCPFCGGEARYNLANIVWRTGYVLCRGCRACSDLKREAEAIEAWNTRIESLSDRIGDGRVPAAPGCEPSASAAQEGVFAKSHPSREAELVEAVGRALTNLGSDQGYFPGIGAPNTRRLIAAFRAYGEPIDFGRCLK